MKTVAIRGSLYTPSSSRHSWLACILVPVSSACFFSSATAQTQSSKALVLEEVTVTAQKREERLQDVPISISVLSGDKLDSFSGGTSRDALRAVPGLAFTQAFYGDNTTLSVRGVTGETFGGSTVGYYVDGVPFGFVRFPFVPEANTYDLDRIEVLRGPQGTLYGASSLNGVVRVLTQEADLNALQLRARTAVSTTKDGDETYRADGAINVPIVEGKLAARATVSYADNGGWIDNLVRKDINSRQRLDSRLKVKAQPTDALSINLSYWRSRLDVNSQSMSNGEDVYPGVLHPVGSNDFDVYGGEIAYELPGFIVSSTTSYMEYSNSMEVDWSAFEINLPALGLFGIGAANIDAEVFSEELLVRSSNDSDWRWSVGAFFRDAKEAATVGCPSPCVVGIDQPLVFSDQATKSESYAMFGEVTKLFLNGVLELTGGLRYFHDRIEDSDELNPSYNPSSGFEKVTPRVVFTWHANKDSTLYTSYSQGFRSGLNQTDAALAAFPDIPPVDPDTLHNYEIGAKGNLLGNRLAYEGAVYYLDWKDVQQSLGFDPFLPPAGLNVGSASGPGAEFSLTLRLMTGLNLTGSFAINDVTTDEPIFSNGLTLYNKGARLNGSSKYNAAGSASYTFPLGGSSFNSTLSLSGSYASAFPQRFLTAASVEALPPDPFFSIQGSVEIGSVDKWSLQLFAENLTNERRRLQYDGGVTLGYDFYDRFMRPRTIGLQFEYKY